MHLINELVKNNVIWNFQKHIKKNVSLKLPGFIENISSIYRNNFLLFFCSDYQQKFSVTSKLAPTAEKQWDKKETETSEIQNVLEDNENEPEINLQKALGWESNINPKSFWG